MNNRFQMMNDRFQTALLEVCIWVFLWMVAPYIALPLMVTMLILRRRRP